MSLPCVVPLRLSCSFWSLWTSPILNWWLGISIDHWSKFVFVLVAMFLLFAAMISEVFKAAYLAIQRSDGSGLGIGLTPAQTIWRIVLPWPSRGSSKYDSCHLEPHARCRFGLYHWLYRYHGAGNNDQPQSWELFPRDYTAAAVIYRELLLWSPSPLNCLKNDSA